MSVALMPRFEGVPLRQIGLAGRHASRLRAQLACLGHDTPRFEVALITG